MTLNGGKPRHDKETPIKHWTGQKAWGIHTPQEIQEWLQK